MSVVIQAAAITINVFTLITEKKSFRTLFIL